MALADGLLVGHASGDATGCTVVRAPGGAVGAVDVRGGGPGTRETDLLDPSNTVQRVNAVLLTGGSAYGLAAADGVMRWLEEHGEGVPMGEPGKVVPIVPAAVIFDLPVGDWSIRPDAEFGYRATQAAAETFAVGSVGAGVGARAGSLKGGVGSARVVLESGVSVGALVVANPVGSVFDPRTGLPWGTGSDGPGFFGLRAPDAAQLDAANALGPKGTALNTTIGVVATDAPLSATACRRMATAAHDGLARAIRPAHSPLDGDTMFALATGTFAGSSGTAAGGVGELLPDLPIPDVFPRDLPLIDAVCAASAVCVERAIVNAILAAEPVAGIPTYSQLLSSARDT